MSADNHVTMTSNSVAVVREENIKEGQNTPARVFHLPDEVLDAFSVVVRDDDCDKKSGDCGGFGAEQW